ncbi:MAG: hypothetical protein GTO63_25765, partial [Anaerolineae bacterium]|nr:hypothetical protein [Anaerolineae bacterium]NIN98141.1 hypothetical protein [Anaerolineae bacterium]NIQ81072.1 hypothetical protein [Anaerolineae bacterium]
MGLIPTSFPDCVVAIGAEGTEGKGQWVASGFFFGHFLSTEEEGTKTYRTYLVSNRHVFEEMSKAYVRCNPQTNEPARVYHLSLEDPNGKALWFAHPDHNVDVAVVPVDFNLLEKHGMQASYFRGDTHAATTDKLVELGITEGDFAYVLGFPM